MSDKFNRRDNIRRYTAAAGTLSAMGAWLVTNQYSELGLSLVQASLLISYNSITFFLLYSVWGPKKARLRSTKNVVVSTPINSFNSLIDIKSEIRQLSHNLNRVKINFDKNAQSLDVVQNQWTSVDSHSLKAIDSTNINPTSSQQFVAVKSTLEEFKNIVNSQQSSLSSITSSLNELSKMEKIASNSLQTDLLANEKSLSEAIIESNNFESEVITLTSTIDNLTHVLSAINELNTDLKIVAMNVSLSLKNNSAENIDNKNNLISASVFELANRFENISTATSDFFTCLHDDSARILLGYGAQKQQLSKLHNEASKKVSGSYGKNEAPVEHKKITNLLNKISDSIVKSKLAYKTGLDQYHGTMVDMAKSETNHKSNLDSLSKEITAVRESYRSATTNISSHSIELMALNSAIDSIIDRIDFNKTPVIPSEIKNQPIVSQKKIARRHEKQTSSEITESGFFAKFISKSPLFPKGVSFSKFISDSRMNKLEKYGQSLEEVSTYKLQPSFPEVSYLSNDEIIDDRESPEVLISLSTDTNTESSWAGPMVMPYKEGNSDI
jgi:hypothetical protein